jgi:hypothetical protein
LIAVSVGTAMAGRPKADSAARASTYWGLGVEAVLPADAATGADRVVSLNSVSCASAGNCSAVGWYRTKAAGEQGLLVSETGGRWRPGVEAVLPANATTNQFVSLNSVSCTSAGNCTAVGSYLDSSGSEGLLLTETAGTWEAGVEAALPATAVTNDQYADIRSISCPRTGIAARWAAITTARAVRDCC